MIKFPESEYISRPAVDLALGERLAIMQGRKIGPTELFRLLNAAQLKGVLVGAHAVNARSGDPRATVDVDIVAEKVKKVVDLFRRAYPDLKVEDHPVVTRFKDAGREAIDVIKPSSSPLFKRILTSAETVEVDGVATSLADIESVLALKYQAMISPARLIEKKYRDAGDFIMIAKQLKRINKSVLTELGNLIAGGSGEELIKLVNDARAGKQLEF
jgi:hypothetical protein